MLEKPGEIGYEAKDLKLVERKGNFSSFDYFFNPNQPKVYAKLRLFALKDNEAKRLPEGLPAIGWKAWQKLPNKQQGLDTLFTWELK